MSFETSMPGVFAIGDVHLNATKRIASAVGEGAGAVQNVHQYLSEANEAVANEARTLAVGVPAA
jgi:thioredoxin reductase (NADPH)